MKKYPFFFWSALIVFSLFLVIELSLFSTSVFSILDQTAISRLFKEATPEGMFMPIGVARLIMIAICCLLFYLGICKKFETETVPVEAKVVSAVKTTMTKTSSTDAPAKINCGMLCRMP